MEPKGSLPRLQEPTTCPYPEPEQSSPFHSLKQISPFILKIHENICTVYKSIVNCISLKIY